MISRFHSSRWSRSRQVEADGPALPRAMLNAHPLPHVLTSSQGKEGSHAGLAFYTVSLRDETERYARLTCLWRRSGAAAFQHSRARSTKAKELSLCHCRNCASLWSGCAAGAAQLPKAP